MRSYGFHSVVGSWTNKHNNGGIPEKNLLTEPQCLMDGSGYGMDENQITTVNEEAAQRANE